MEHHNKNPIKNLAEYASTAKEREAKIDFPLTVHNGTVEGTPLLHVLTRGADLKFFLSSRYALGCFISDTSSNIMQLSLKLMELRTIQEPLQAPQRAIETPPPPPSSLETLSPRIDELSVLKAGLRKVKSFQMTKKACHEENNYDRCCVRSEDAEDSYPFATDSLDNDGESEESNWDSSAQSSFNHETLGHANKAGGSFYSNAITNAEDESRIYYNHRKQDMGSLKRKLSFISAKPKSKGEPLLKKDCGEGGDDIDFDSRQLSSSDESSSGWNKLEEGSTTSRSSFSEFGDDKFAVGSWEAKKSERAAGDSACTALAVVIAKWLQSNQYEDAYYIIDALGERLYEGCNQAHVLKFDKDTTIWKLPMETKELDEKTAGNKVQPSSTKEKTRAERRSPSSPNECEKTPMEEEIVCKGKESCKEYIKSFLAAIPIRELRADIKKGLMASTPLHHRLQIEFHYTQLTQPVDENSARDVTIC
ncbi:hypothetical protein H0E87_016669 [Populus deltoides]|uniref:Uncharacterized protein n=1 Tax=Populus deltoides TaxID=3696 RepID=A0A8T2YAB7_POPDE|nr:hypothetical protein H0E87_016669 [Populus deltoides]